jgi:Rod binding domain-containing protein
MLPTDMMKAFGKPEIEPVAREVEDVILQMMREAASDGDCVKSLLP